jgi:RNA polymerase sigma factor (sigma-70 family)
MTVVFEPGQSVAVLAERGAPPRGAALSIRVVERPDAEYTAFFRAEFASVTRAAYLIVRDRGAAEDVAQEAFTQLLLHWSKISRYERPDAWVRRIAIRRAVRFAQRERLRNVLVRWMEPPRATVESSVDPDLAAAIQQLPPQQRAAVVLHYFEDRPLTEVATILGCSHATAKVHVFKARQRLAQVLRMPAEAVTDVD